LLLLNTIYGVPQANPIYIVCGHIAKGVDNACMIRDSDRWSW